MTMISTHIRNEKAELAALSEKRLMQACRFENNGSIKLAYHYLQKAISLEEQATNIPASEAEYWDY